MSLWQKVRSIVFVQIILGIVLWIGPVAAQTQAVIRLETSSTAMETGQPYDVVIRIENASPFWTVDIRIAYDPKALYILGTKSGSPVTAGPLFSSEAMSVTNRVERGLVRYIASKVGKTTPAEGNGMIGTFRVYPLQEGTTRLQFSQLQVVGLSSYDLNATNVTSQDIPVVPALLDLVITGRPVEAPIEATATPQSLEISTQVVGSIQSVPLSAPTLENIIASTRTPISSATQETPPEASSNNTLGIIAAFLIVIAVIGLGVLMRMQRHR